MSEISGAVHFGSYSRQADEIQVNFEILNSLYIETFNFI